MLTEHISITLLVVVVAILHFVFPTRDVISSSKPSSEPSNTGGVVRVSRGPGSLKLLPPKCQDMRFDW